MVKTNLIIATDVDGTITNKERRISPTVIRLFRRLQSFGVKIILVSSHTFPAVSALGHYIGVDYIIAETGGVFGAPWKPIFIQKLENRNEILKLAKELGFKETPSNPFRYTDISLFPPKNQDPLKAIDELEKSLSKFEVKIEYSGYAVHVIHKTIDKGWALKKLIASVGISGPIIAFGDGLNDRSLFEVADLAITSCMSPRPLVDVADIALPVETLHAVIMVLKNILMFLKLKYTSLDILEKIREMFRVESCS